MTDSTQRRRLVDILDNGNADNLREQWDSTEAAADFAPLPAGTYECHIMTGELGQSRKGTPQYTLTFKVIDGEYENRQVWHTLYLTAAALPMAKRDLAKIAVTDLTQLETPLPVGVIRCRVKVALRTDDNGEQYNRVKQFTVLCIDEPERDPFALAEDDAADGPGNTPETATESVESAGGNSSPRREYNMDADGDSSFDPAQLDAELSGR